MIGLLVLAFIAANAIAWQPGVGGRQDRTPGTELGRYFGWPAVWRAELWESNDPALASRTLREVPFYAPAKEMQLRHRYTGVPAILIDVALLLASRGLAVLFSVPAISAALRIGLGTLLVTGMIVCGLLAQ